MWLRHVMETAHSETLNLAERDGEIVLPSSFICRFLSPVNTCLPAIAPQQLPRGLELSALSFNEE